LVHDDNDAAKKFEVENPIWAGLVIALPHQTDPGFKSVEAWTELLASVSPSACGEPGIPVHLCCHWWVAAGLEAEEGPILLGTNAELEELLG
jgi:hypothetical protein